VTTSQGIALFSNANTRRYHRGLVRNVEDTDDYELPEADTRVADVDDAASFLARLERGKTVILHLPRASTRVRGGTSRRCRPRRGGGPSATGSSASTPPA
jgi:hypothetical protein